MTYDLVIRNGRVIDGTGTGSFLADVAIQAGRIALVGRADAHGRREIDADGRVVAPGFIDTHTHYDAQLFWDPLLTSTSWHGFTTVVMGHCGISLAPVQARDRAYLLNAFASVEDIPLPILEEHVAWRWESYADYLDALDRCPLGINVVPQVGHSALRRWVLGEDYQRAATAEEIEQMRALLRASLRAGAGGFTSSHGNHVDLSGTPVASRYATRDELLALADVLGKENTGVYQMSTRTLPQGLLEEERQFLETVARTTRRPVTLNGLDPNKPYCASWLAWLEQAAARGARVRANAQVIIMEVRFAFDAPNFVNQRLPVLLELARLPRPEAISRLRQPDVRAQALQELEDIPNDPRGMKLSWARCWVGTVARPEHAALVGQRVVDLARAADQPVSAYVLDLALAEDLATEFRFVTADDGAEALARAVVQSPYALIGVSDGGGHLGTMANTHVSTSLLGHWVREKGWLSLEEAVRKLTFVPAVTYGLVGRGLIQEGYFADLVIFDPKTIGAGPALTVNDLPGGGKRMVRPAQGIAYVLVNGTVVLEDSMATGAYPGRVLRNGRARSQ